MLDKYKICNNDGVSFFILKRRFLFYFKVRNYDGTVLYFSDTEYAKAWIETDKILSHELRSEEVPQ